MQRASLPPPGPFTGSCRSPTPRPGLRRPASTAAGDPCFSRSPPAFKRSVLRGARLSLPHWEPSGALARSREREWDRRARRGQPRSPPSPRCQCRIPGSQALPGPFCENTNKVPKAIGPFQSTTGPKDSHQDARNGVPRVAVTVAIWLQHTGL